ncbi:hypothetical protein LJR219_000424 [Phenylobacterium sp. LjRoot219]|uniref:hypothetical protein n=1 Tax=Phenylobacterium sp. LjRoot219 TaxID=3342283 RepID=UPI003ECF92DF
MDRKAGTQSAGGGPLKHVLVFDQDPAIAEAVIDLFRTQGLAVERVRTEFEALQRLSSLPTVRTVVVAGRSGAHGAGEAVAHFARRVIPGVVVITLNSEARGAFADDLCFLA